MCRCCVKTFNGKYLQQCKKCGHPAHDPNLCVVGSYKFYRVIVGKYEYEQHNCSCPDSFTFGADGQ